MSLARERGVGVGVREITLDGNHLTIRSDPLVRNDRGSGGCVRRRVV